MGITRKVELDLEVMSKILYITPGCFDKGGISRYNRYQIRCLSELHGKDNIRVISLIGPDQNSIEEPFEVYWHGGSNFTLNKIRFVLVLLRCLFFWRPNLLFNAHVNFSGIAVMLSKLFGIKTILNVYGSEVWSGLGPGTRMGLIKSHYVLSDCHNTADYVKSHYRKGNNISVIWDCVDLDKFKHDESRFDSIKEKYNLPNRDNYFLIMTLGRMSIETDYQGYSRLITVLDKVLKEGKKVKLIMAGSGGLVETLREKTLELQIESEVTFTGSVDENDMASLYSYGHVFSLVTESGIGMGEGIPLTPLEAMACKTPIIVGNQDGSREAIFEPINGYVISPDDLILHAKIIGHLADDPALLKSLAANAETTARQYFCYDLFKAKHKDLLDKVFQN